MEQGDLERQQRAEAGAGRAVTVVHLDDEELFLDLTARQLEREGMEVVSLSDPETALACIEAEPVDCVVSDYQMPGMDGIEFLEAVREDHPELPFLLFTGKGSEEVAGRAISAGVSDYLQKQPGEDRFALLSNRIENAVAKHRAERRAAESDRRVREVHDRVSDAVVAVDSDWRYTYLNGQAERLLDVSEWDLLGERLWDAYEFEGTAFESEFREAVERREPTAFEAYDENTDAWYEVRAYPDEDGCSIYFRDVTERRERELRYEAIFNQTYQFTGLMEPDGTLIEANETALAFGGLDRDDVVGEKVWDAYWFQHGDAATVARAFVDRAADGEFVRTDLEVQGADGVATIDFSVRPVTDETGEVVLLIPEGRDITELKRHERELERQNQRLEEFANVVSHDLRNRLSVAKGSLSLVDEENDRVETARAALDRMAELTENVLTLAKGGAVVDDPEIVVARDALQEAVAGVSLDGVDVTVDCPPGRRIRVDSTRFPELVENLLVNAAEHGGDRVEVGLAGDTLVVADDGPGIPETERERVFEAGHSSAGGTGFGLAIVESIAEAHGWSVAVGESEWGGARFAVSGIESPDGD